MFCEGCGALFVPQNHAHRFCKPGCRFRHNDGPNAFERPFVAYDGEGQDPGIYTLLADSTGRHIKRRSGLRTVECLEFLLRGPKGVNNVWFGIGYDVNMLLVDLPLHGARGSLEALHRDKETFWGDYYLRYIPRKQFLISKGKRGTGAHRSFNSYDTLGFFQASFEQTCADWLRDFDPLISQGKAAR